MPVLGHPLLLSEEGAVSYGINPSSMPVLGHPLLLPEEGAISYGINPSSMPVLGQPFYYCGGIRVAMLTAHV